MPVKGICHAFQFVQSLCFLALAEFANCGLPSCIERTCRFETSKKQGDSAAAKGA